jgi:hypothetical protein
VLAADPATGAAVDTYYLTVPPLAGGEAVLTAEGIAAGGETVVLDLYRCTPGLKGVEGLVNQPV